MSYTPTTWETGDTITAAKLNNMETGIGTEYNKIISASISVSGSEYSIDSISHTPAQVAALLAAGVIPTVNATLTGAIPDVTIYCTIPYTQRIGDVYTFCGTIDVGSAVSVVAVDMVKGTDTEWSDSSDVTVVELPIST